MRLTTGTNGEDRNMHQMQKRVNFSCAHFEFTFCPVSAIRNPKEDSKPSDVAWISSMDKKKSENVEGSSQRNLIVFANHSWNTEMSLNCRPGIVVSAMSIRKKQCLITSCTASIFVCDICFSAILIIMFFSKILIKRRSLAVWNSLFV